MRHCSRKASLPPAQPQNTQIWTTTGIIELNAAIAPHGGSGTPRPWRTRSGASWHGPVGQGLRERLKRGGPAFPVGRPGWAAMSCCRNSSRSPPNACSMTAAASANTVLCQGASKASSPLRRGRSRSGRLSGALTVLVEVVLEGCWWSRGCALTGRQLAEVVLFVSFRVLQPWCLSPARIHVQGACGSGSSWPETSAARPLRVTGDRLRRQDDEPRPACTCCRTEVPVPVMAAWKTLSAAEADGGGRDGWATATWPKALSAAIEDIRPKRGDV